MSNYIIIDRRKDGSGKSIPNREKFLKRQRRAIADAVRKTIKNREIKDINKSGVKIKINKDSIEQPVFNKDYRTGVRTGTNPGNVIFESGDEIYKPEDGEGQGGQGGAGADGDGEDDFTFTLTKDEFIDYFFKDLELPNMVKSTLKRVKDYKNVRAGFSEQGNPSNLDLVRSMRNAIGRRAALKLPKKKRLKAMAAEIEELSAIDPRTEEQEVRLLQLLEDYAKLESRAKRIPFLDDNDLKYRVHKKIPNPANNAVMFCLMDVSGSMGSHEKDLAKRFFFLLYLFLECNYDMVEMRFIRYHHEAREVDEETFFYDRDSGGTIVSSAFDMVNDIIDNEYPLSDWNIYIAHASDGDNWGDDISVCQDAVSKVLPKVQYISYIEVCNENGFFYRGPGHTSEVAEMYHNLINQGKGKYIGMTAAAVYSQIYEAFVKLFKRG